MQWFKHQTNMRNDIKIRRLINRYGIEGYGLYNLILETIVEGLDADSPLPILQETAEDVASFYKSNTTKVEEIIVYMVNQGLFDFNEHNEIVCIKVYKYLQQSQTRSDKIRKMIEYVRKNMKDSETLYLSETNMVKCEDEMRRDEMRIDKIRIDEMREERHNSTPPQQQSPFKKPSIQQVTEYFSSNGYASSPDEYYAYYSRTNWRTAAGKPIHWIERADMWEDKQKGNDMSSGDFQLKRLNDFS